MCPVGHPGGLSGVSGRTHRAGIKDLRLLRMGRIKRIFFWALQGIAGNAARILKTKLQKASADDTDYGDDTDFTSSERHAYRIDPDSSPCHPSESVSSVEALLSLFKSSPTARTRNSEKNLFLWALFLVSVFGIRSATMRDLRT